MSEISTPAEKRWLAALFLAAAVLYSFGMTRTGFEGKDERRYAQVAKELTGGSGLFVMHYLGDLYPDKPPLFFWAEALSFRLLGGVSPAAARLPLFISALAALAFAYALMRQIDGPRAALAGTAALALSFRFLWAGRWVKLDMPMCVFTFAAFWATARILFPKAGQKPAGPAWALAAWASAGLAVLAKGPAALVWLGAILTYAAARRDGSALRRHRFGWGLLVLAAVVGAWLGPAMALGGPDYYGPMFGSHVAERFVGLVRHEQPFWYFFPKFLSDGLPMTLFLPVAVWQAWGQRRRAGDDGRTTFLLAWIGFGLVFFSIPSGKRGQYVLPLYPAAALLAARFFWAGLAERDGLPGRVLRWHLGASGWGLVGAGAATLFSYGRISREFLTPPPLALRAGLCATLAAGGAAGLLALRRGKGGLALAAQAGAVCAAYLLLFGVFFPLNRDDSTPRGAAERIAQEGGGGAQVGLYGIDDRFTLYGEGVPRILDSRDEAASFMSEGPDRWLLATNEKIESYVAAHGAPPWREVARWPDRRDNQPIEVILYRPNGR